MAQESKKQKKMLFLSFSILSCIFFILTSGYAKEPKQQKQFPLTINQIVENYNNTALAIKIPISLDKEKITEEIYEEKGKKGYYINIEEGIDVGFITYINSEKPFHVMAFGIDDGTERRHALIALNSIALISAVTPHWKGDERGEIIDRLGLMSAFPPFNKMKAVKHKKYIFNLVNNKSGVNMGIIIE